MNERQKQNQNFVQGSHQTNFFISKNERSAKIENLRPRRDWDAASVVPRCRRLAHALDQKTVVAPATAGYTRSILIGRVAALPRNPGLGGNTMEWATPQHESIDLNCEVSSYANAEL
jgi:hypothetical protein